MTRISAIAAASALALPILFSSASALAAQLVCSGSYLFYQVQITANVSGNQVVGPGRVTVRGPGQSQSIPIAVHSGSYVAQSSLSFSGISQDGQSRGVINSAYNSRNGYYIGDASVSSPQGNFSTQVACRL